MTEATSPDARNPLLSDLKTVIADAEELLKATAGATGERISAARARAEETLRSARQTLSELDSVVGDRAKETARATDQYVREHPWGAVGIAALAGLLVGVMIARR